MTDLDELYDKEVKCPVCNTIFTTKKVRVSKLKLIKRDEDFMPYYEEESPLKYSIFLCPNCGYAAEEDKFKSVTNRAKEIITKEISSKWKRRSYGGIRTVEEAIETHKLAFYIGQLLGYSRIEMGLLSLNTAWLYRLSENKEEELRFLRLTKNYFEEAYYKDYLLDTSMDEIKLGYLLGEINRRIGDKKESLKWFSSVVSNPNINSNPTVKNLAMEQWKLVREE